MASTLIPVAAWALAYTAAAITILAASHTGPDVPRSMWRSFGQMVVCLASGLFGGFAESRGWNAEQILVAVIVVCSLDAAIFSGMTRRRPSIYLAVPSLIFVAVASVFAGDLSAPLAGLLAAIPFGVGAFFFPRSASVTDTLYSAIAGATLGLMPAILILCVATFITIVRANRQGLAGDSIAFSPSIATITFVAVLGSVALSA